MAQNSSSDYARIVTEMNGDINEMDIAISQIITECENESGARLENNFINEGLDEMDLIMSQMTAEGDLKGYVDLEGNCAYEVLEDKKEVMIYGEGAVPVREMDSNGDNSSMEVTGEMNDENANETVSDIPPYLLAQYEKAMGDVIPGKSAKRYIQAYDVFTKWQESNGTKSVDEKVIMAYFVEAGEKYAPSTLWSMYSMLKSTLIWKQNIDISNYSQLVAWIKRKNDGYKPKQFNILTPAEISRFVSEAPDIYYLAMKAILGFGIIGVLRGGELTNLKMENVKDTGEEIIVHIPKMTSKTKNSKMNVIDCEFTNIIHKYIALRPSNVTTNRFLQYRKGKCVNQVIGKNYIAKIPKEIAKFLKLPNPDSYTGHSYRRSGTTMAANNGATFEQLLRIGDWKSTAVCKKYIQESVEQKRELGKLISDSLKLPSSTATTALTSATVASSADDHSTPTTYALSVAGPSTAATYAWSSSAAGPSSEDRESEGALAVSSSVLSHTGSKNIFNFTGNIAKFTIVNFK